MIAGFTLSDDKALLQRDRVYGWIANSYWGAGVDRERFERSINFSHCVGAYRDGEQIGFARVVTDYASFAWLADVMVDLSARGTGVGRAMVCFLKEHPELQGLRRWMLATRDAHQVYAPLGFTPLGDPALYMEITAGTAATMAVS